MKTTNNTAAPAKMDAATIANTAAGMLKKYKTIAAIKAVSASNREKFGASNWAAIFSKCKEFRAADINAAAKEARENVFTYSAVLESVYTRLAKDNAYKNLCKYAAAAYKGDNAAVAAAVVRDYYANVDETGMPLTRAIYADTKTGLLYTAFVPARLSDTFALSALKKCLTNMAAAARKASRKSADNVRAVVDNVRAVNTIVGVYENDITIDGSCKLGVCLAGAKATTAPEYKKAAESAAALIGRAVPAACEKVSELNALARASYRAAAEKALIEKEAAIKADAAAAGLKTAAPAKKGRKAADMAVVTA